MVRDTIPSSVFKQKWNGVGGALHLITTPSSNCSWVSAYLVDFKHHHPAVSTVRRTYLKVLPHRPLGVSHLIKMLSYNTFNTKQPRLSSLLVIKEEARCTRTNTESSRGSVLILSSLELSMHTQWLDFSGGMVLVSPASLAYMHVFKKVQQTLRS